MRWEEMIALADLLDDECDSKEYIQTTCRYGYYLYGIYEQIFKGNLYALEGGREHEVAECVERYESLWREWQELYKTAKGCPTLFAKEDVIQELIGYNWNRGLDSAVNPLRNLDENGKLRKEFISGAADADEWGLG